MTEPTDAELWQLYMQQPGQHKDPIDFARAALAKWGTPATVEAEPVAWAATSEDGDVEALGMNQSRRFDTPLYTTPQPTHAQAGAITPPPIECNTEELKRAYAFGWWSALEKQRETAQAGAVPLSIAEEERMLAQWDYEMHGDRARYIEAAHGIGIKGGQHGTE